MPFVFSGLYLPSVSCFTTKKLKGLVIQSPIGPEEYLKRLHPIDLEKLQFVGDSLKILRQGVEERAALTAYKYSIHMLDSRFPRCGSLGPNSTSKRYGWGAVLRVHGNVDPSNLLSLLPALTEETHRVVKIDIPAGHILKPRTRCLGRDVRGNRRSLDYETLFQNHVLSEEAEHMCLS
ncbi:hypothetical protein F2Q70_00006456 [Brassica cretica]|uniref:Uncharacterized protein n=1 Tax=Brassica cretica TaxID=69181 RepID=A0A8S9IZ43_BRACR|nr:hypothetical protein F2Q70_00006456 [Brassica cretica]